MIESMLWRYTLWLVVIRMLLPIALVVLRDLAGLDLTRAGIPVASAVLSAAVAGRIAARIFGRMPTWRELLTFAVLATFAFFVVNYIAYLILAQAGIGPIHTYHLVYWYRQGEFVGVMMFLTSVAFVSNVALYPISAMIELNALSRQTKDEHIQ
ncbi:ABZJ_00895 family protein [uncultured Ruegeria sp.]|uniref:ABZJ_00895 family protein n=1 Tax=uncultured Ruegeria sp. TaxID=259304 RepID=UPI00260972F6|nr:ABZJ_00895 family protein [uncultured Ruegeria sp.]